MGNYKGFGDSKFVPALPMERLELLILASEAAAQGPSIPALWQQVSVIQESSVADPWNFGVDPDPDPRIHDSD